uniref:Saposin B-type domain-containing protein n=1 Tax=Anguilla anguilla TaxID=7936 RepID=A0A0E9TMI6_ANGAN
MCHFIFVLFFLKASVQSVRKHQGCTESVCKILHKRFGSIPNLNQTLKIFKKIGTCQSEYEV